MRKVSLNCAWLILSSLVYLAVVEYHEVNGFGFDDLDFARRTIESVAKSITSKPVTPGFGFRLKPSKTKAIPDHHKDILKGEIHEIAPLSSFGTDFRASVGAGVGAGESQPKPRNLNKFNEAMDQVERAMAQAELSRMTAKLPDLRNDITNAVNRGNVRFARRALGIALYTARKESKRRGKRSTGYDAKNFLNDIKKDLGKDKFSDFLALQGQVSLMFALDVTGSMSDEIKASKEIIQEISQYGRIEPVNFIVATFSDPIDLTNVNYFADDQINQLITHVDGIKASGGEDCPEFSFDGMINALYEDPRWGSPLYVFTDAPPKDANEENKETLRVLAEELKITVNFFAGKTFCGSEGEQQPFKDIVETYGGQYLKLASNELSKMARFTDSLLDGTATVGSGKSGTARRKRRATTNIGIPIDDTVTQLVVTVTTERSPYGVQLYTPTSHVQTAGRTILSRVIFFSVNNPIKGFWKLVVPSSVGKYEYSAKVISPENIDFEHYFSKRERGKWVNLRNPLAGQSSKVSLTVSGASKIQKSSLLIDIIDVAGNTLIANKRPTAVGKSGIRFNLDLVPPNKAFKLMLKGKTNGGKSFQRISRHVDSAKPLVVKEYYTYRHYTIPQKGSTSILFYLFNGLKDEKKYDVSFRTKKGYKVSLPGSQSRSSRMKVRGGSKKFLRVTVRYDNGTPGKVGKTLNVFIFVRGRDKSFITTEVVPLMII